MISALPVPGCKRCPLTIFYSCLHQSCKLAHVLCYGMDTFSMSLRIVNVMDLIMDPQRRILDVCKLANVEHVDLRSI